MESLREKMAGDIYNGELEDGGVDFNTHFTHQLCQHNKHILCRDHKWKL